MLAAPPRRRGTVLPLTVRPVGFFRRYWLTGLFCAAIGTVGAYAANLYLDQDAQLAALRADAAQLGRQWKSMAETNQQLQSEVALLGTDEHIEMVARQRLGLVKPGEISYMTLETVPGPGSRK